MSDETIVDTPVKRGPGRPRKAVTETTTSTVTTTTAPEAVATQSIPDDELENYGGDIAAWDSIGINKYTGKPNRHLARRSEFLPGALGTGMPDLNAPGTFVHKDAPHLKFHWTYWDDSSNKQSKIDFLSMKSKGYKPALVSDWIVCPELRDTILDDGKGRLTFAASKDGAYVVMYQSEKDYRYFTAIDRRHSDEVQKSAEQKAAELQESLRREGIDGARAFVTVETTHEKR